MSLVRLEATPSSLGEPLSSRLFLDNDRWKADSECFPGMIDHRGVFVQGLDRHVTKCLIIGSGKTHTKPLNDGRQLHR
jgi:hypothetical protein